MSTTPYKQIAVAGAAARRNALMLAGNHLRGVAADYAQMASQIEANAKALPSERERQRSYAEMAKVLTRQASLVEGL